MSFLFALLSFSFPGFQFALFEDIFIEFLFHILQCFSYFTQLFI
jgi:hypothetical protein